MENLRWRCPVKLVAILNYIVWMMIAVYLGFWAYWHSGLNKYAKRYASIRKTTGLETRQWLYIACYLFLYLIDLAASKELFQSTKLDAQEAMKKVQTWWGFCVFRLVIAIIDDSLALNGISAFSTAEELEDNRWLSNIVMGVEYSIRILSILVVAMFTRELRTVKISQGNESAVEFQTQDSIDKQAGLQYNHC